MKESNFLYHCLDACFSPYKLFFSLHTSSSLPLTLNPASYSMYIYSSKSPCKKAVFTSSCSISRFKLVANPKTTRIEDIFITWENISSKSTPFFWPKLFTTNLALYCYCELISNLQPVNSFVLQCPICTQILHAHSLRKCIPWFYHQASIFLL